VPLGEVSLFVREMGAERPGVAPLLVVHGGPDWDHSYLLPGVERIARSRRVIAFDLRGCGRSTRGLGPSGYQPEFIVSDIVRLLGALGHERADVVGFSVGGQVAQLLVAAHPGRVRRLVLASTTAYPEVAQDDDGSAEVRRRRELVPPWPDWAPFERGRPGSDVEITIAWAIAGAPMAIWNLDRLDEYLGLLARVRFSGEWIGPYRRGLLHPWRPSDPVEALRRFGGPTLILHGAADMTFPIGVARRLHDDVPTSCIVELESAGHMAHFDRPEEWADAVCRFLDA